MDNGTFGLAKEVVDEQESVNEDFEGGDQRTTWMRFFKTELVLLLST